MDVRDYNYFTSCEESTKREEFPNFVSERVRALSASSEHVELTRFLSYNIDRILVSHSTGQVTRLFLDLYNLVSKYPYTYGPGYVNVMIQLLQKKRDIFQELFRLSFSFDWELFYRMFLRFSTVPARNVCTYSKRIIKELTILSMKMGRYIPEGQTHRIVGEFVPFWAKPNKWFSFSVQMFSLFTPKLAAKQKPEWMQMVINLWHQFDRRDVVAETSMLRVFKEVFKYRIISADSIDEGVLEWLDAFWVRNYRFFFTRINQYFIKHEHNDPDHYGNRSLGENYFEFKSSDYHIRLAASLQGKRFGFHKETRDLLLTGTQNKEWHTEAGLIFYTRLTEEIYKLWSRGHITLEPQIREKVVDRLFTFFHQFFRKEYPHSIHGFNVLCKLDPSIIFRRGISPQFFVRAVERQKGYQMFLDLYKILVPYLLSSEKGWNSLNEHDFREEFMVNGIYGRALHLIESPQKAPPAINFLSEVVKSQSAAYTKPFPEDTDVAVRFNKIKETLKENIKGSVGPILALMARLVNSFYSGSSFFRRHQLSSTNVRGIFVLFQSLNPDVLEDFVYPRTWKVLQENALGNSSIALGKLLADISAGNPARTIKYFLPRILGELSNSRHQSAIKFWLFMTSSLIKFSNGALLEYKEELESILDTYLSKDDLPFGVKKKATILLRSILSALTDFYPTDVTHVRRDVFQSEEYRRDPEKFWGYRKVSEIKLGKESFHIPTKEEIEYSLSLVEKYWTDEPKTRLDVHFMIVLRCIQGTTMLPEDIRAKHKARLVHQYEVYRPESARAGNSIVKAIFFLLNVKSLDLGLVLSRQEQIEMRVREIEDSGTCLRADLSELVTFFRIKDSLLEMLSTDQEGNYDLFKVLVKEANLSEFSVVRAKASIYIVSFFRSMHKQKVSYLEYLLDNLSFKFSDIISCISDSRTIAVTIRTYPHLLYTLLRKAVEFYSQEMSAEKVGAMNNFLSSIFKHGIETYRRSPKDQEEIFGKVLNVCTEVHDDGAEHWRLEDFKLRILLFYFSLPNCEYDILGKSYRIIGFLFSKMKHSNRSIRVLSYHTMLAFVKMAKPVQPVRTDLKTFPPQAADPLEMLEEGITSEYYNSTVFFDDDALCWPETKTVCPILLKVYDYTQRPRPRKDGLGSLILEQMRVHNFRRSYLDLFVEDSVTEFSEPLAQLFKGFTQIIGGFEWITQIFPEAFEFPLKSEYMEIVFGSYRGLKHMSFEENEKAARLLLDVIPQTYDEDSDERRLQSSLEFITRSRHPVRSAVLYHSLFDGRYTFKDIQSLEAGSGIKVARTALSRILSVFPLIPGISPTFFFRFSVGILENWMTIGRYAQEKMTSFYWQSINLKPLWTLPGRDMQVNYEDARQFIQNLEENFLDVSGTITQNSYKFFARGGAYPFMLSITLERSMHGFFSALADLLPKKTVEYMMRFMDHLSLGIMYKEEEYAIYQNSVFRIFKSLLEKPREPSAVGWSLRFLTNMLVTHFAYIRTNDDIFEFIRSFLFDRNFMVRKLSVQYYAKVVNFSDRDEQRVEAQRFMDLISSITKKHSRGLISKEDAFRQVDGSIRGLISLGSTTLDSLTLDIIFYLDRVNIKSSIINGNISQYMSDFFSRYSDELLQEEIGDEAYRKLLELRQKLEYSYYC